MLLLIGFVLYFVYLSGFHLVLLLQIQYVYVGVLHQSADRLNKEGVIYGLTYVDHKTKCVFNGSDLGKQYSAKGILERCSELKEITLPQQEFVKQSSLKTSVPEEQTGAPSALKNKGGHDLLETLLKPEHTSGYVPHQLTHKGSKKRKKRITKRL